MRVGTSLGGFSWPHFAVKPCGLGIFGGHYGDVQVRPIAQRELARLWLKVRLAQRPCDPSQNVTNFCPYRRV